MNYPIPVNATPSGAEHPAEAAASLEDAHAAYVAYEDARMVKACVWALRHGDSPEALVEAIRKHVERVP